MILKAAFPKKQRTCCGAEYSYVVFQAICFDLFIAMEDLPTTNVMT
jgi:hypothetical protein